MPYKKITYIKFFLSLVYDENLGQIPPWSAAVSTKYTKNETRFETLHEDAMGIESDDIIVLNILL